MNFEFEDQPQPKYKKILNYLKHTFYYDYYTYKISNSSEIVKQLLAARFKKLGDNRIVILIYAELPDDDSLYMEYKSKNNYLISETSNILSSTCLKGKIYSDEHNHTIIDIGVRAHSKYLILFVSTFIAGLAFAYNSYNKNKNDLLYLLPLIISLVIMFFITKVANNMKTSLRKEFENIVSTKPI